MEFCEFIKVRDNFSNNIVFSDKATFELHGNVNANADNCWTLSTHTSKSILIKRNSIVVHFKEIWISIRILNNVNFH